jgi:hypothetical protein
MNKRYWMAEHCHPHKVSAEQFAKEIRDSLDPFIVNMKHLDVTEPLFIEEWLEMFARWTEIQPNGYEPFEERSES